MKASPSQVAFNAGEFSELTGSQFTFAKYKNALSVCENMVPLVQGGLTRRTGTKFVAEVKDSSKTTRLIPFEYSVTQAYVLEFDDLAFRVYKDRAQVLEATKTITGVTQANPAVVTSAGHGLSNGDEVYITGVVGMTQLNGRNFKIANVAANTFELQSLAGTNINSTGYTAYSSGGTAARVYTVTTTYAQADLFNLKFTQSADVLYITHPSYPPRKITRTGHTNWTISTITFKDGPYLSTNNTAVTITPSGTTGAITLTASSATFASTDVGRMVRIKHSSTWGYATITGYTSSTVVDATVTNAFGATTASTEWRLGLYCDTLGYPSCVTFFEDRLFFAGSTGARQRLDGSVVGDYENFAPSDTDGTVADDSAVSYSLNSNDVNAVRWMMNDEKGLLCGTAASEWVVRPSSLNEALTPTNISAKSPTSCGSANLQALRTGKSTMYVQRTLSKIRELAYVYEIEGFKSPDMTVLNDVILTGGVTQLDYQQEPLSVVWFVRTDGQLIGLTYERDQDVLGWHRHIIGGTYSGGDAVVESVAVIPTPDNTADEVWLIVKRTIGGTTKKYIEYITPRFTGTTATNAYFVDGGLTYSGSAATTISGLWHLEGQTLSVLADGAVRNDVTVSNGQVTLSASASVVHLGYSYESNLQTLRIEAGAADGTAQGKTKRIHRVMVRLYRSLGQIFFGPNETAVDAETDYLFFRTSADLMGSPPALFTGDSEILWNGTYETDGKMYFRQSQPLPFTLLGLFPQLLTQDR